MKRHIRRALENQKISLELRNIADLIKVAKEVISAIDIDQDGAEQKIGRAIRHGDTIAFDYTKKDGSTKRREIVPLYMKNFHGKPAVSGYEVNDQRQIQKTFYLENIAGGQKEQESPPVNVKVPSGFHVLKDNKIADSMKQLVRSGGRWKSDKQAKFLLSMVGRGNEKFEHGTSLDKLKSQHPNAIGFVVNDMRKGSNNFSNNDVYVIDAEGVAAQYLRWARGSVKREITYDRLEDLMDDYGGKIRNIPRELLEDVEKDRYEYENVTSYKYGVKEKWSRR